MSTKLHVHTGVLPKIIEGISPEVELTPVQDGVWMTVTTKTGSKRAFLQHGKDYVLTEEDIEEIGDRYTDIKTAAEAARDAAQAAASQAETTAGAAAGYSAQAERQAGLAGEAASAADVKASDASRYAADASLSAAGASSSAAAAGTSEANAAGSATAAEASRASAASKASEAAAAADAAHAKAQEAGASAQQILDMTVSATGLPAGSTPTVQASEVDGHKHLTFGLVPGNPGADGYSPVRGTDYWTEADQRAVIDEVVEETESDVNDLKSALTQIESDADDAMGAYPTFEESGNIITTKSGADNIPVSDFSAVCDCLQDAGTPSLTSVKYVRPHYYIDVVMAKKNLFGGIAFANAVKKANPNATIDVENGTVRMQAIWNRIYVSGFFKANTRYSIIFYGKNTTTTTSTNVYVVYTDGTREQLAFSSSSVEAFARYYTLDGKTVQCIQSTTANTDALFYYDKFGIFEGDVAISGFVPFDGVAYAINFPETLSSLYGAIIEKIGDNEYKITQTHRAVNLGSLTWTYASGTFRTTINGAKYQGSCKCECFEYVKIQDLSELQDGQIASTNSQELNFFRVKADNYSTVESFVSAVNNKLLVYELYEPIVYTVSGDEIKTIFGENNIYTNVGSVSSIGIRNDTALYVDSKVPELEEYGIPVLYFNGEAADMSKSNEKKLALSYHSPSSSFDCYVKMKWQGTSSLAYPKKNYTIKLYSDSACTASLSKDFGWGSQSKYCLKANWIDFSMARNICSARMWGQIVKNRTGVDQRLSALPNGGAIDGFPCAVVINGDYTGLYTFNIPKEGWMFGMGNSTTEAIVCADGYGTATQFNKLAELDGSDFKLEYDGGAGTEAIKTSLNRLIQSVMDATSENFDSTVGQYLDINSAIDYYIFTCMVGGGDMVEKNYLLATYDGTKWFFSAYDMDTTFGLAWDGSGFSSAYSYPMFATYTEHNLLMDKLYDYKLSAIKTRYVALRQYRTTDFNFQYIVYQFMKGFPKGLKDREVNIWAELPSTDVSNASQITTWFAQRLKLLDMELNVTP